MSEPTHQTISPLISNAERDGSVMKVTFRCPVSEKTFESVGALEREKNLSNSVTDRASQGVLWSLRRSFARMARSFVGGGLAGSIASNVAYDASSGMANHQSYSEEEKKAAVVAAFKNISYAFVWDEANSRYVAADTGGSVMTAQ